MSFICDECRQYNADLVTYIYKNEFKSSLKQNESEIKALLEAIEIRHNERFKKKIKFRKCVKKTYKW